MIFIICSLNTCAEKTHSFFNYFVMYKFVYLFVIIVVYLLVLSNDVRIFAQVVSEKKLNVCFR